MAKQAEKRSVTPDGDRVLSLRQERGLNQESLAAKANVSPRTVGKIERSESVFLSSLSSVAAVLQVELSTLILRSELKFTPESIAPFALNSPRSGTVPTGEAEELIQQIRVLRQRAIEYTSQAEGLSLDLLGALDHRHYFISTTTAIRNYVWYENPAEAGVPDLIPGRARSLHNGALFLMLVPNEECFQRIRLHTSPAPRIDSHAEIIRGFATFRRRAINYLREEFGDQDAEGTFDRGQRILQCKEFPFTGAGWTVNLLGQVNSEHQVQKVALIHGPYSNGLSLQLWDQPDHFFPGWLEPWMRGLVDHESHRLPGDLETQQHSFYSRLHARMLGRTVKRDGRS